MRFLKIILFFIPSFFLTTGHAAITFNYSQHIPGDGKNIFFELQVIGLKKFEQRLRKLDSAEKWEHFNRLPANKNDSLLFAEKLKSNLHQLGYYTSNSNPSETGFSSTLIRSLKTFRQLQGMDTIQLIDRQLIRWMNVPVVERMNSIKINIKRCEKLQIDTGDFILINIPDFQLQVIENDRRLFSCKVIVGKSDKPTPTLRSVVSELVFNPYWYVPNSIIQNELLPILRKRPHYLATNHMEWKDGILRQLPGPWNSLGKIKFYFENPFGVYLHDTPTKGLFDETVRAFSHGCVRLQNPDLLLDWVLNKQEEKIDKTAAFVHLHEAIKLQRAIPIMVIYLTTWVDEKGRLISRKDIYGKDRRNEVW